MIVKEYTEYICTISRHKGLTISTFVSNLLYSFKDSLKLRFYALVFTKAL